MDNNSAKQTVIDKKVADDITAVNGTIIRSATPVLLQNLSMPIYVIVDTIIVGQVLGVNQLAALNIGSTFINALVGMFIFLSSLTNATVSRAIGQGDKPGAIANGRNCAWLGLFIGIIFAVLVFSFSENICRLFTDDINVITYSTQYLQAVAVSIPGILVCMAANGLLRGMRMFKLPMYITIVGYVLNVSLNVLFVVYLQMGIFGSGLATGLTMILVGITDFAIVLYFVHINQVSRRFAIVDLLKALNEAVPYIIRSVILWMSILLLVKVIATLGPPFEAAYQIIAVIWVFEETIIESIEIPLQTLIGEKIGAKNYRGAKHILDCALKLGMKACILLTIVEIIIAVIAPSWFTSDSWVQQLTFVGLIESAFIFFHACFAFLMDGALIASGDTMFMARMCAIAAAVYVPLVLIVEPFLPANEIGLLVALGTYDFIFLGIRAVLAYYRYRHNRWMGAGVPMKLDVELAEGKSEGKM